MHKQQGINYLGRHFYGSFATNRSSDVLAEIVAFKRGGRFNGNCRNRTRLFFYEVTRNFMEATRFLWRIET